MHRGFDHPHGKVKIGKIACNELYSCQAQINKPKPNWCQMQRGHGQDDYGGRRNNKRHNRHRQKVCDLSDLTDLVKVDRCDGRSCQSCNDRGYNSPRYVIQHQARTYPPPSRDKIKYTDQCNGRCKRHLKPRGIKRLRPQCQYDKRRKRQGSQR